MIQTETPAITYRKVAGMTADKVPFELERLGESDLWSASVAGGTNHWTSTVNSQQEAEAAALILADRVVAVREARARLVEAENLAAQRARALTAEARAARGEADDEPPF